MTLKDLKAGESAIVTSIDQDVYGIERLKELGVTVNSVIKVIRYSPFNDPLMINIRGCDICIRKNVALKIGVRKL